MGKGKGAANKVRKVIIDGDWGPDEAFLTAVLAANSVNVLDEDSSAKVEILGVTTVYGNSQLENSNRNALNLLHYMGLDDILVHSGASKPGNGDKLLLGDDAWGGDGIGGVKIEESPENISEKYKTKYSYTGRKNTAVDFILNSLSEAIEAKEKITITATGPLTNIAEAIKIDKEQGLGLMKNGLERIVVMGGCTADMEGYEMASDGKGGFKSGKKITRRGNITPHAEFNFQQAPKDASYVMNSGLPVTLLPMNVTHGLTLTPEREERIETSSALKESLKKKGGRGDLLKMMKIPEVFERCKFKSYPVFHDVNCALYILYPELYKTATGVVSVETGNNKLSGRTEFEPDLIDGWGVFSSNVTVATGIVNRDGKEGSDDLFYNMYKDIVTCFGKAREKEDRAGRFNSALGNGGHGR